MYKFNFNIYIISIASILSIYSCDDMLQPKIDNTYPSEETWRLPDKARGVLYNAYAAMGTRINAYDYNFLDCATDDAITNDYASDIYRLSTGALSPSYNPLDIWNTAYAQFKNIHLFIENGLSDSIKYSVVSDDIDLKYKNKYKGEAYFLRAWWGWQLLKNYGGKVYNGEILGYPIVLSSIDGNTALPRNSYEDCVEQIIADLDTALVYLPMSYSGNDPITGVSGQGRASGNAALVLKAIVYLYAASDAYQPDGTTEGERKFKWIRAAYAADQAIRKIGQPNILKEADFGGASNSIPNEFLLAMSTGNTSDFEKRNFAPYYYGSAMTNPTQNLAEAFPMKNGYPVNDLRSGFDKDNPFEGRDPRFYLNFYYNGASFKNSSIETFAKGRDSYETDARATRTGYYLRKWIVENVSMAPGATVTAYRYYPLIRKTEVWFAFIEAANQAWGPYGSDPVYSQGRTAYDALLTLRKSLGMNDSEYLQEVADKGTDAFDDLIMNERRIEFSFENHRYYDLRRRMRMEEMSGPVYGLKIKKEGTLFSYEKVVVGERNFDDEKYIYAPIPYQEIIKNPNMIQNIGWE